MPDREHGREREQELPEHGAMDAPPRPASRSKAWGWRRSKTSDGVASARKDLARYGGLGMQFAATIGLLAWLGYRLDLAVGTLPLFLLVGVFTGFAGGLYSLLAKVPPTSKRNSASSVSSRSSGAPESGAGDSEGSSDRDGS